MGYTFTFAFKKLGSVAIGGNKSHNLRLHATSSQLKRKEAWITAKGHHTIVMWDDAKIEKARNLAKRKDAVVAIAFSVQLGAQTDWREEPTEEFPEGKPKAWEKKVMNGLHKGAKEWACEEFGEDNLVSVELHTDESTPHVQFVVTPIHDGKLQAKHWLDGSGTCAKLRRRACDVMNRYVECQYTPGNPGGNPHDPDKSAGAKSAPEKKTVLDRVFKNREKELEAENEVLRERVRELEQAVFSKKKVNYTRAMIEKAEAETKAAKESEAKAIAELKEIQDKALQDVPAANEIAKKEKADSALSASALIKAGFENKQLQKQLDAAQLTGLEWRTKYQQEHVRANGLARDMSQIEDEFRALKREINGNTDPNPFK